MFRLTHPLSPTLPTGSPTEGYFYFLFLVEIPLTESVNLYFYRQYAEYGIWQPLFITIESNNVSPASSITGVVQHNETGDLFLSGDFSYPLPSRHLNWLPGGNYSIGTKGLELSAPASLQIITFGESWLLIATGTFTCSNYYVSFFLFFFNMLPFPF